MEAASVIGIAILTLIGFWLFGGVVMRASGFLLVLTGAGALAIGGDPGAVVPILAGVGLWACGRLHRAAHRRAWVRRLHRAKLSSAGTQLTVAAETKSARSGQKPGP
jgi:hypothetical protein